MKHITTTLCLAYAAASIALLRCAVTSQQNGSPGYCALFAACSILLALGIVHHAYYRDEMRAALVRLDRATRPQGPTEQQIAAEAAEVWRQLDAACCLRGWESAGAEHDPHTCTRKDQTT